MALCFYLGLSSQKMEQNPQSLSVQESEKAILTCSYANYSPVFFQWYRQDPGRGPVFLLLIHENERTKLVGRLRATFDTTIKQSSFYITASQPADSATYLCAAGTQQGPAAHFLHPNPSGRQGREVEGDPANHPQSTAAGCAVPQRLTMAPGKIKWGLMYLKVIKMQDSTGLTGSGDPSNSHSVPKTNCMTEQLMRFAGHMPPLQIDPQ